MNIFILDSDPSIAATFLCDKHISKMAVETTQLLYTAHSVLNKGMSVSVSNGLKPYKQTHVNHPCSKWTRESKENYEWLAKHGLSIVNEYSNRYNKQHACLPHLVWLSTNVPPNFAKNGLTPFVMAFYAKDQTKHKLCFVPGNPVQSYRNYYKLDKSRFAKWNHCKNPYWW